jgi:hypothetical protein
MQLAQGRVQLFLQHISTKLEVRFNNGNVTMTTEAPLSTAVTIVTKRHEEGRSEVPVSTGQFRDV